MSLVAEAGVQLHLPTFKDCMLPDLLDIGRTANLGGFKQLWITDNLQSRNTLVVLGALAVTVPVKLGTAVIVQYFHNPVGLATGLASISELMQGRELCVGIGRGNQYTDRQVTMVKPISMLRETAQCLDRLLNGQVIEMEGFPTLRSYFNFAPQSSFKLDVEPPGPVHLYCGGNAPLSLAVGGEYMHGILWGPTFRTAVESGQLGPLLRIAEDAAFAAKRPPLRKAGEIKISISGDNEAARAFVRDSIGGRIIGLRHRGYTAENFLELGIRPEDVDRLEEATNAGVSRRNLGPLVTDAMIDAFFIAGDPDSCKEKVVELCSVARNHGFQQVVFSELGPNIKEALGLLSDKILPIVV